MNGTKSTYLAADVRDALRAAGFVVADPVAYRRREGLQVAADGQDTALVSDRTDHWNSQLQDALWKVQAAGFEAKAARDGGFIVIRPATAATEPAECVGIDGFRAAAMACGDEIIGIEVEDEGGDSLAFIRISPDAARAFIDSLRYAVATADRLAERKQG